LSLLQRLGKYVLRNWIFLAFSIVCMVVTTALSVYIPQLGGKVIREILERGDYGMLVSLVVLHLLRQNTDRTTHVKGYDGRG